MKKIFSWIGLLATAYILQSSFLNLIAWHGVGVNLMLLFTVSFALTHGSKQGTYVGFCCGLLQDVASGTFFGLNTFSLMVIGFVFGLLIDRVYESRILLPLTASIGATCLNYLIKVILVFWLGYRFNLTLSVMNLLLPALAYNFIFAYFVHRLVCWLKAKTFAKRGK